MKTRLGSLIVAGTLLTAPVGAHLQGSIAADHRSRLFDKRRLTHTPVARAPDLAPGGRNLLVYVIAGFTFQFGSLDLSNGEFLPIGPGVPPDVGGGLVQGLGTSLLDAMACSRAIVATRAGGIPEVVDDGVTGSLVPPRDHAAMAQAIIKLLKEDRLRKRMGEAGLARVTERFTVERMVVETAAAYVRLAGRGHEAGIEHPEGPAPHPRD